MDLHLHIQAQAFTLTLTHMQMRDLHLHGGLSKTMQTPKSGSHIDLLPWVHSLSNFLPGFGPTSFFFGFTNCPTSLGSSIVQLSANFIPPWVDPLSYFSNFTIAQFPLGHPPSNFNLPQVHLLFHFLMCIGVHGCSSSLFSSCTVQLPWGNGVARFIYHPTSSRELDQA